MHLWTRCRSAGENGLHRSLTTRANRKQRPVWPCKAGRNRVYARVSLMQIKYFGGQITDDIMSQALSPPSKRPRTGGAGPVQNQARCRRLLPATQLVDIGGNRANFRFAQAGFESRASPRSGNNRSIPNGLWRAAIQPDLIVQRRSADEVIPLTANTVARCAVEFKHLCPGRGQRAS
jgi:hypothetical protein